MVYRWLLAAWFVVFISILPVHAQEPPQTVTAQSADDAVRAKALDALERKAAAQRAKAALPHDDPDAAAAYHALQRQIHDDGPTPIEERYRRAEVHMDGMRRYVSAERRIVEPGAAEEKALGTWSALGPGNIGGRARALVVHPTNPNILWTGGVSGGLWKTTNGGQRWEPLTDQAANIAFNSLAIDPANPNVLYAGTGEGYQREVIRGTALLIRGGGIFKTTNGTNFFRLGSTNNPNFHFVNALEVSPITGRIYAATRTGVWRSQNGGESWQRILSTTVQGGCLDLALRTDRPNDVLFAACGSFAQATVYRSLAAEAGGGFEPVLTESAMGRTSLALAPSNQDVIYALSASITPTVSDGGLHALFRSDTGGASGSWQAQVRGNDSTKLNRMLLSNPVIAHLEECDFGDTNRVSSLGWHANLLDVDPTDPMVVFAGGVDLFRSDNGGADWGLLSYWWDSPPSAHADQHTIRFHPGYNGTSNQTLFLSNDGGVWRTDNARARAATGTLATCNPANTAVRWRSLNRNLGITQFYHGAPFPDGRRFFGGTQDNGTLIGGVGNVDGWQSILGGDGGYVAVNPTNTNVLYAETQGINLYKSVDGGQSFVISINGITETSDDVLFIKPFTMDPNQPQRLWTGGRRLWRTDNGANSWQAASAPLGGAGQISAIAVARNRSGRVLVGTSAGTIHRNDNATAAGGGTPWPSALPRAGYVTWIAFDPNNANVAYATYAGFGGLKLWKTTDGGATWSSLGGSGPDRLPDIPLHSIIVDPDDSERLYLGSDLGVLASIDGGQSWMVENTGFARAMVESLSIVRPGPSAAPLLFAFTHGRGAFRVALEDDDGGGGGDGDGDGTTEVPPSVCEPSATTLCLGADDRFQITVEWRDFAEDTGAGTLVEGGQTADSGLLWFFEPDNWEMLVKVVNGCPVNNRRWIFLAAITNVDYTVTVTDTLAGRQKVYRNPLGTTAPAITDTASFATCP